MDEESSARSEVVSSVQLRVELRVSSWQLLSGDDLYCVSLCSPKFNVGTPTLGLSKGMSGFVGMRCPETRRRSPNDFEVLWDGWR